MFTLILAASLAVPFVLFVIDARRTPAQQLVLSHFWYFTLIWMAAFPLRAWLIGGGYQVPQVIVNRAMAQPTEMALAGALAVAFAYWLVAYGGYRTAAGRFPGTERAMRNPASAISRMRLGIAGAGWVVLVVVVMVYLNPSPASVDGSGYLRSRMGSGLIWMLPELCVPAFVAFLGCIVAQPRSVGPRILAVIFVGAVLLGFWVTVGFSSRRIFAAILLGVAVFLVIRRERLWPLGAVVVLGSVFAAGVLELVRRVPMAVRIAMDQGGDVPEAVWKTVKLVMDFNQLKFLSTSFEGAEHVARLLEQASPWQVWTGIDHGISWLFNLGLSFVPRAIWSAKPLAYGGIEQMAWLYPGYVKAGIPTTAIPTSFVVDFAFGFGLPAGLILAFVLGRYLRVCEGVLWQRPARPAAVGFSLITFIFMFNIVRGGTAIGQALVPFAVIASSMVGLRVVLSDLWRMAADTLGLPASTPVRVPRRVFFYPHRYLRDRQLDTIRRWPRDEIVNPDVADGRAGAQVSKTKALAAVRRSWIQILPLLNVKRRPAAPKDAAVYVWGALVASGPFIVDLDNPYTFTGYNVFATRLYRSVIRRVLAGDRCLSVHCLSRACLDGVRELFGEAVAAKALVAYPAVTPRVAEPPAGTEGRCRFLFVATQFEIKGGAALLGAFRRVAEAYPGATLDMITHLPPEFAEATASCPGVTVHEASFSRDQVAEQFLAHADVLVHPTYCESLGMVVPEAMAFGLPVIATRVYAIPEMVEDGVSGILLDPPVSIWKGIHPSPLFPNTLKVRAAARAADTRPFEGELADAMLRLARDPEHRRAAGRAALARVAEWSHQSSPT